MVWGMLWAENVHFSYEQRKILTNLNFSCKTGEIVSLVGASGSGKTTLFRLITGLIKPDQGQILINDQANNFSDVTYMQQEDLLLPWRTTLENVLLVHELNKTISQEVKLQAVDLLKKVGLKGFENAYPAELSGGMRQRASLARALLQKRPLLLLDEPFGSLDIIIREELYELIQSIVQQENITMLFVTHDFRDAFSLTDRILVLRDEMIAATFPLSSHIKKDPVLSNHLVTQIRQQIRVPASF